MVVGVGVGVGVGEEGGVEEMDAFPPHALIMIETGRKDVRRRIRRGVEEVEEFMGAA